MRSWSRGRFSPPSLAFLKLEFNSYVNYRDSVEEPKSLTENVKRFDVSASKNVSGESSQYFFSIFVARVRIPAGQIFHFSFFSSFSF